MNSVSGRRSWMPVAFAVFVMAWGGNHFTPLLTLYERLGHHSIVAVNLLFVTYVAGLAPGLIVAGPSSTRWGRRPTLAIGLIAGLAGSVVLSVGLTSEFLLGVGRALAGLSVGTAMSVGATWIRELSIRPNTGPRDDTIGAQRSSLALTLGFGVGAGVSGAVGQWGPIPTLLPYIVHISLALTALIGLFGSAETVVRTSSAASTEDPVGLRPLVLQRRVLLIIVPIAPWVFAAAGLAYATMPQLLAPQLGSFGIGYAALLTVVTLGAAAAIQPFVSRINAVTGGRALIVGLVLMLVGVALAYVNGLALSPVFAAVVAIALGLAYGLCLVAGLIEVQRLTTSSSALPYLVGLYYSVSYSGFALPVVLASLAPAIGYPVLLASLVALCAGTLAMVLIVGRVLPNRAA